MKKVICLMLLLSGCALFDNNKTPLTPQGQMNVCIRDEVRAFKDSGKLQALGIQASAQKIADTCTSRYNLSAMYAQAVQNAKSMMSEDMHGTTLRRW